MDFTLIKKTDAFNMCYKLLRSNFYRGYYIIIIQSKQDFVCESFASNLDDAIELFNEISSSATEPYTLRDIILDYEQCSSKFK